jgi:hypothetical protein
MGAGFRRDDGKFDYSAMSRVCKCGHELADHSATGSRRCFVGQNTQVDAAPCPCPKFAPVRARKKTRVSPKSFHGVMVAGARMARARGSDHSARIDAYVADRACR